jgi:hypothetical protein
MKRKLKLNSILGWRLRRLLNEGIGTHAQLMLLILAYTMQDCGLARALVPGDLRISHRLQATGLNESSIVNARLNKKPTGCNPWVGVF